MYAQMGMRIEEWDDGSVNIGLAVCPSKPTALLAVASKKERSESDFLTAAANTCAVGNFVVIPQSAYLIRTPVSFESQGGVSIACSHQQIGPQNFIIMIGAATPVQELVKVGEFVANNRNDLQEKLFSAVPVDETCPAYEEKASLKTPHETERATVTPPKEIDEKKSGGTKRVSWTEDTEKMNSNSKSSRSNSINKDDKRDPGRKSNGEENGSGSRVSQNKKTHHRLSTDDMTSTTVDGNLNGNKRSDDSRIPNISGDYAPSCEFYRRQMYRECVNHPTQLADNWYDYTSLQRYAGQKVVKKIAAEQKRLEEDISNRRKTEIWVLGSEHDDVILAPSTVPFRKRTTRLRPIEISQ